MDVVWRIFWFSFLFIWESERAPIHWFTPQVSTTLRASRVGPKLGAETQSKSPKWAAGVQLLKLAGLPTGSTPIGIQSQEPDWNPNPGTSAWDMGILPPRINTCPCSVVFLIIPCRRAFGLFPVWGYYLWRWYKYLCTGFKWTCGFVSLGSVLNSEFVGSYW